MWDVTNDGCTIPSTRVIFLLTHPVWDVTKENRYNLENIEFLLTHPVWDVTSIEEIKKIATEISTHTSRVGCDLLPL